MTLSQRHRTSALCLVLGVAFAASCTVDKSAFIFDDDEFNSLQGDGDGDAGDGDGDMGGTNGDGDTGGTTGDGDGDVGMGGSVDTGPEPGDLDCDDDQVVVYAGNDLWVSVGDPCEFICTDGQCSGNCDPGDTQCIGSVDSQWCDGDGVWNDAPTCIYACDADTGACSGECVPGNRQCNGNQKQICDETGTWTDDGAECANGCDDSGGDTNAVCTGGCTTGTSQCLNEKQLQTCVGGQWNPNSTTCPNVCFNDQCIGECNPYGTSPDTRCNPGNGDEAQACTAPLGKWGEPYRCDFTCVPSTGDCGGNCVPGAQGCQNGAVVTCDNSGTWKIDRNCSAENLQCVVYNQNGAQTPVCGVCNPGTTTNPVRRCHIVEDEPNSEECVFDPDSEITRWETKERCAICFQGSCFEGEPGLICEENPNATGCAKSDMEWKCNANGDPKETLCPSGFTCNFNRCEQGGIIAPPEK